MFIFCAPGIAKDTMVELVFCRGLGTYTVRLEMVLSELPFCSDLITLSLSLSKTNSLHLKLSFLIKGHFIFQASMFRCKLAVSFREGHFNRDQQKTSPKSWTFIFQPLFCLKTPSSKNHGCLMGYISPLLKEKSRKSGFPIVIWSLIWARNYHTVGSVPNKWSHLQEIGF